jgi:hypothetical protein
MNYIYTLVTTRKFLFISGWLASCGWKAINIINVETIKITIKQEQKGYAWDTGGCIRTRMQ